MPLAYAIHASFTQAAHASLMDEAAVTDDVRARLRKVEGQLRGVRRMVSNDRPCVETLTQITAVQGALDEVALELLERHVRRCDDNGCDPASIDELVRAVAELRRPAVSYSV
jgi:CsoR family transcriptional regulator, copper-sensing transcriptional repressor